IRYHGRDAIQDLDQVDGRRSYATRAYDQGRIILAEVVGLFQCAVCRQARASQRRRKRLRQVSNGLKVARMIDQYVLSIASVQRQAMVARTIAQMLAALVAQAAFSTTAPGIDHAFQSAL